MIQVQCGELTPALIEQALEHCNITLAKLAQVSGVPRSTIANWIIRGHVKRTDGKKDSVNATREMMVIRAINKLIAGRSVIIAMQKQYDVDRFYDSGLVKLPIGVSDEKYS